MRHQSAFDMSKETAMPFFLDETTTTSENEVKDETETTADEDRDNAGKLCIHCHCQVSTFFKPFAAK